MTKKIFVLDTNVILHDARCIENFAEHDVVIPITVLEEIDKFKRGNEDIHFQARQFMRSLDEITGPILEREGVSRGPGLGILRIVWWPQMDREIQSAFMKDVPDHRILNAAVHLKKEQPERPIVLVSKDINLRMKAKSMGLTAEDYEADKVPEFSDLYKGKRLIEGVDSDEIEPFFDGPGIVEAPRVPSIPNPIANENFEALGFSDKIRAVAGDFFKEDLPKADLITMCNVLHDWGTEGKKMLIRKAHDSLPDGGALVVIENIIDNERSQNAFGLMMSLNMLIETDEGFDFSLADFSSWANQVGFSQLNLMPLTGPASAIVAYK